MEIETWRRGDRMILNVISNIAKSNLSNLLLIYYLLLHDGVVCDLVMHTRHWDMTYFECCERETESDFCR